MDILKIICRPLLHAQWANGMQPSLQALSPTAGFTAYLKIGILSGLILSAPWVILQAWRFVAAGLYQSERRFLTRLVGPSVGLFVIGVLFMYWVVLPIVLQFFISFNNSFGSSSLSPLSLQPAVQTTTEPAMPAPTNPVLPLMDQDPANPADGQSWVNMNTRRLMIKTPQGIWSVPWQPAPNAPVMQSQFAIDFYISFVLMLSLAFGLAFETPLVVFFLAWSGVVPVADMRRARRYVLLGIVIAAAVLTPPDVISQLLLAAPMYLLFELGLLAARRVDRSSQPAAES